MEQFLQCPSQAEALQQLMLPILRADLEAIEGYSYKGKDCLNCPVTACMGASDTEVTYDEMCHWQTVTEGDFELNLFDGGHFYLNDGLS